MRRAGTALAALCFVSACRSSDVQTAPNNPSWCQSAYPALSGRVVDTADIIAPEDEVAMTTELAAIETKTQHQMVVATVPSLEGRPILDYSVCLARHWGIGRKDINDGVVILLASQDRKARIEVGYGLERALSDPEAQRIMDDDLIPAFKNGSYADGLKRGIASIGREIGMPQ